MEEIEKQRCKYCKECRERKDGRFYCKYMDDFVWPEWSCTSFEPKEEEDE